MRDDQILQFLRARNPWWRAAQLGADQTAWTAADPVLRPATAAGLAYDPEPLPDVHPGGLWILWGPRRVGKSVTLRRTVARLCERVDGRRIVSVSLDGLAAADLRRLLVLGRRATEAESVSGPRYWLLDEVTAIEGWEAILKEARDQTELAEDAVILTGSSAAGFGAARTMLGAGRAGSVVDPFRILLPMSFRSFVAELGPALPVVPTCTPDALQTYEARRAILELGPFVDELDLAWQRHLEIGGFPRAVADAKRLGDVGAAFVTDLVAWLIGDIDPEGPAESVTALLSALERRTGSPLDQTATAVALDTTRDRLRNRLHRLQTAFATLGCAQVNDHGVALVGGRSKVYLADPLLARLPSLRDPRFAAPDGTRSTEAALAVAMARAIDRLHPDRWIEQVAVGHLRTGSGNEIDLAPMPVAVGGTATSTTPIEAKWVSRGWKPEARTLVGRLGRGIVATKDIIDLDGPVWAVPAPIVALLLG